MSLVTEALRKARQEAAAREAARRGKPVPIRVARPPRGRFDARKLLAVAALALGAALAGAGLVWWMLEWETPAAVPLATATPAPAPALHDAGAVPTAGVPVPAPVARTAPATTPPRSSAASGEPEPTPGRLEQPVAALEAPVPPGPGIPVAPSGSAPASSAPAGRERVFVLDADLGRVKLHLDFVVYKPSAPFASINSRQVVPGSIVDGLVVDEIGRDFVRLVDSQGSVVLRVR